MEDRFRGHVQGLGFRVWGVGFGGFGRFRDCFLRFRVQLSAAVGTPAPTDFGG